MTRSSSLHVVYLCLSRDLFDWESLQHVVYCRQWKLLVLTWWSKFVIEKGRVCSSTRVEDDSISCFGDVLVFILNFYLGTKPETRQSKIFYSASGVRNVPMLIGYFMRLRSSAQLVVRTLSTCLNQKMCRQI